MDDDLTFSDDIDTDTDVGGDADGDLLVNDFEYEWMVHGKCRGADPSMFFPSDGTGVERAQRICGSCAVQLECLEYALEHRIEHGVWGGASERERRRILRRRRAGV